MIKARGLARRFSARGRTVDAVKGVDLDIGEGELVGFLGPNGAGKTTTLRMLTTLLSPTSGEAEVAGRDLRHDPLGVRERIGYVAQSGGTHPESTVSEEVELQGRLYGLSKTRARQRGSILAEQLDISGLGKRPTKTLSGGQRRRLDIALGLVHAPGLVFFDEPTTGLDPQSRANLWEHIRTLRAEHGITLFLTTHYLEEADSLCDRILVIDDGRIVAGGTPDELKARVSGDGVEVGVPTDETAATAELAGKIDGARDILVVGDAVRFRVPHGDTAMPELLRALDAANIPMRSMRVDRPTLDDVFLTMTGRSLREADAPVVHRQASGGNEQEEAADVA